MTWRPAHPVAPSRRRVLAHLRVAVLLVSAVVSLGAGGMARADSGGVPPWTAPENLSKTPTYSAHPAILADPYGNVHVFWSEALDSSYAGAGSSVPSGDTIMYAAWNGSAWSAPRDVLFVPGDVVAEDVSVALDGSNRLHAVWTGLSNFYYSSAPAADAGSGRAWTTPVTIATNSARTLYESAIVADSANRLYIFYATRGSDAGVYCIVSPDGGTRWGDPVAISTSLGTNELGFANLRAIVDRAGRLHVVWQTYQSQGFGQAIYYTRSLDGGVTWATPTQMRYRGPNDTFVEWPSIVARGDSELQIIYVDGSNKGRAQRTSLDAGGTWSQPFTILSDMEGVNGFMVPLVDGAGDLHLIADLRTQATQDVGIYYYRWLGNGWSSTRPVAIDNRVHTAAHYAAATVRLGNEIFVVWNDLLAGEIWSVHGMLPGVTPSTPLSAPTEQRNLPAAVTAPSVTPTALPGASNPISPGPTVTQKLPVVGSQSFEPARGVDPLLLGVGGAASFMLAGIVWSVWRQRRALR
ncbi:MAG TPA: sialidase family protein [Anaerolineae bacterium]